MDPDPARSNQAVPLTETVLQAFASLRLAESTIDITEARELAALHDSSGHEELGFAVFGDMTREYLQISPRSAWDRLTLHRVLSSRPRILDAFRLGRITSCQVLALRAVFTEATESFWIEECGRRSVRDLKRLAHEMKAEGGRAAALDIHRNEEFGAISFKAPPPVVLAWQDAIETARRVLGWDAPPYRCLEAMLAEAALWAKPDDMAEETPKLFPGRPAAGKEESAATPAVPGPPLPTRPGRALSNVLRSIREMTSDIQDCTERPGEDYTITPFQRVQRIRTLQGLRRPLNILTGRLLRETRAAGLLVHFSCSSLREFAEEHLHLSEGTAWNRIHESRVFLANPSLEAAYSDGQIGLGHAMLIDRVASGPEVQPWILRARAVLHRQYLREVQFQEKLQGFQRTIALNFPGPFPQPGLEGAILAALKDNDVSREAVRRYLKSRKLLRVWPPGNLTSGSRHELIGRDPAENPLVLRRLEALLDLLILSACRDSLAPIPQTFANAGISKAATTIRIWSPRVIIRWWRSLLSAIREKRGPMPAWMIAALLIRDATGEWTKVGISNTIAERDGYLCQAPGCSRRRDLHVHHIRPRSQGGGNENSNRITLCFRHHRKLLHEMGSLRVEGEAPHNLTWTLGGIFEIRGEKYLRLTDSGTTAMPGAPETPAPPTRREAM